MNITKIQEGSNTTFKGYVDPNYKEHIRKLARIQAEMWVKAANHDGKAVDEVKLNELKELPEKIISNFEKNMKKNFHPKTVLKQAGDFYYYIANTKIRQWLYTDDLPHMYGVKDAVAVALYHYNPLKLPKGYMNHTSCPYTSYKIEDQKKAVKLEYHQFAEFYYRPYIDGIYKYLQYLQKTSEDYGKDWGESIDRELFRRYVEEIKQKVNSWNPLSLFMSKSRRKYLKEVRILKEGEKLEKLASEFNTDIKRCDIGQVYIRKCRKNIPENNKILNEMFPNNDL